MHASHSHVKNANVKIPFKHIVNLFVLMCIICLAVVHNISSYINIFSKYEKYSLGRGQCDIPKQAYETQLMKDYLLILGKV